MRKKLILSLIVFGALIGSLCLISLPAHAEDNSSSSGQALEISPPVITLSADPGETIETTIKVRDISSTSLLVSAQINDFVAADENGTPKLLVEGDETSPYSMKDWVSPLDEMTLEAKQIEDLPVTINVPSDAAPGGYYAVIRFTGTPPEIEGTGVSLSASVGSLVMLRINGDVNESLAIEEFSVSNNGAKAKIFESDPLDFKIRVKNNGNVYEQPVGKIIITDMFGHDIAGINVNLDQRNVLQQSIRAYESTLDDSVIGNRVLFGRYTASLTLKYGSNDQEITSTLTFWVLPLRWIGLIIVLLVGGFFGLRFLIKRYNRYIINQAQKQKSKK